MVDALTKKNQDSPDDDKRPFTRAMVLDVRRVLLSVKRIREQPRIIEQTKRDAHRLAGIIDKQLRQATDSKA